MREIIELMTRIQALLEELAVVKTSSNRGRINALSSEILGAVRGLPNLFRAAKRPNMFLGEEMDLLAKERDAAFLLVRCFGYVSSKQRDIGPLFQELLVDIYDSANEGRHYLTRDEVFERYHGIVDDIAESAFSIFRKADIKNIAKFHTDIFMPWVHGICSPIRKTTKRYFRDELQQIREHRIKDVTFEPKEEGIQVGTKAHIIFADDFSSIMFHVKAHQNYGASSSGVPSSQRKEIDLKELFVYKLLEHIGFGPKTYFITHHGAEDTPVYRNALFIATQDVAHTKKAGKTKVFHKVGQLFSYDGREFRGDEGFARLFENELSTAITAPIKLAATIIDLLSRILHLTDMNEGNFGKVSSEDDSKWKILDFVVDSKGSHYIGGPDRAAEGFIEGNGAFRYSSETLLSKALVERTRSEKIAVGLAALEILVAGRPSHTRPETRKMGVEAAVDRAFHEVLEYMQTDVSGEGRAKLLGITEEDKAYENLQRYVETVLLNFHDLMAGLRKGYADEIATDRAQKIEGSSADHGFRS